MTADDSLVPALILVLAVVVIAPLLMMLFMLPATGMWGGHMWNGGMWDGGGATWIWLLMWAVPLLVISALVYLGYRAIRNTSTAQTDPALEELRRAYARGDLTDEEFEQRRERLDRDA